MVPPSPPDPLHHVFSSAKRLGRFEALLPQSWRIKRFAKREAQVKANLVKAIRDYWSVAQDPRAASRQDRRRFSRELADLIAEHIGR